ncbi:MAG: tetratricopeptide repeat protein [Rhodospirillales bacterium]|nr:tetratricopeptide repeat protein [Rhodospirillales bacterium]
MSLTLPGWLLVVASIAISALLVLRLRSDAASLALLARLRSSGWGFGQDRRGGAGTWIVAAAAFLLVAGVGAATSYLRDPPEATSSSLSRSGLNGDMLARLEDYARSNGAVEPVNTPAASKPLPDVNTMIARLEARLESTPGDIKGWRMLGWSYFNTGHYEQAAAAYARAVKLDPNSAELKSSYEEAKAKASGAASPLRTGTVGNGGHDLHVAKSIRPEAKPPTEQDAAIRAMVDGLAGRLEQSPRDVEGWTRLMRSRVVLGETEVAATALRKALEVFKDDHAATGRIKAAATEFGLKAE